MNFARKIKINVVDDQDIVLDSQSKMCNWLYNNLLERAEEDYKNGSPKKLMIDRNLRNQVPIMKEEYLFLKTVFSSPTKNVALRLKDAYKNYFSGRGGHPKFRSWKKNWFSLLYEEPWKGYSLDSNILKLSLGKDENGKQIRINLELAESLTVKEKNQVVSLRITKDRNNYYAIFSLEKADVIKDIDEGKWISFDPNHKNLMVGIDYQGHSIEFARTDIIKYWDKIIDGLKSRRDKCERKSVFIKTYEEKGYWQPSRRWTKYNDALEKAYATRREQNKQEVYSLANSLMKCYDAVLIGDYVPSTGTAKFKNQRRSMLNQTYIGTIRKTVEWVAKRSGKQFRSVDEYHTTKECPFCGFMESKEPSIRIYTCPQCGTTYYRDLGSAINIAVKDRKLLRSDYSGWKVERPEYTAQWNWHTCRWQAKPVDADEGKVDDFPLGLNLRKKMRKIA